VLQWTPQGHRGRGRPRIHEKEIWRKKCGQQRGLKVQMEEDGGDSTKTELDGDKWSLAISSTGSDKA